MKCFWYTPLRNKIYSLVGSGLLSSKSRKPFESSFFVIIGISCWNWLKFWRFKKITENMYQKEKNFQVECSIHTKVQFTRLSLRSFIFRLSSLFFRDCSNVSFCRRMICWWFNGFHFDWFRLVLMLILKNHRCIQFKSARSIKNTFISYWIDDINCIFSWLNIQLELTRFNGFHQVFLQYSFGELFIIIYTFKAQSFISKTVQITGWITRLNSTLESQTHVSCSVCLFSPHDANSNQKLLLKWRVH